MDQIWAPRGRGRVCNGFLEPVGSNLAEYGPEQTHDDPIYAKRMILGVSSPCSLLASETRSLLTSETCSLSTSETCSLLTSEACFVDSRGSLVVHI